MADIVLATQAGYFGSKRDKDFERSVAPFAVYVVRDGRYHYLPAPTAAAAVSEARRIAAGREIEWDNRTQEEA